ncbi:hypothetical protein D3Z41_20200, partial [Parabacteroides distasonis]|uniref:hypothetical protein n=1 Tax=Bacteroidales TaxID=171549 RepID=UPI00137CF4EF
QVKKNIHSLCHDNIMGAFRNGSAHFSFIWVGTIQVRRIGLFMDAYLLFVPVSGDFWKILLLYSQSPKIP